VVYTPRLVFAHQRLATPTGTRRRSNTNTTPMASAPRWSTAVAPRPPKTTSSTGSPKPKTATGDAATRRPRVPTLRGRRTLTRTSWYLAPSTRLRAWSGMLSTGRTAASNSGHPDPSQPL